MRFAGARNLGRNNRKRAGSDKKKKAKDDNFLGRNKGQKKSQNVVICESKSFEI